MTFLFRALLPGERHVFSGSTLLKSFLMKQLQRFSPAFFRSGTWTTGFSKFYFVSAYTNLVALPRLIVTGRMFVRAMRRASIGIGKFLAPSL